MAAITVEVAGGLASWSFEDTTLEAGEPHEIKKPTKKLTEAVAAAVAAGALTLLDGSLPADAVESDVDSLARYEAAAAARAPLYAERDRELYEARGSHASDEQREQITSVWDDRMAEAAQAALEA